MKQGAAFEQGIYNKTGIRYYLPIFVSIRIQSAVTFEIEKIIAHFTLCDTGVAPNI